MSAQQPSRIEQARQRSASAKSVLTTTAAAFFVAALLLARASHPGQAGAHAGSTSVGTATQTDSTDDGSFELQPGSLGSSNGSQPQVQTSVS